MNMNKNQKYFEELQQYFTKKIYEKYDAEIIEIAKFQNKSKETILNELGRFLLRYTDPTDLKNKDKIIERIKFQNLIDKVFTQEIAYETEKCEEIHTNTAKDKFYSNEYIYSIGVIDYTLKPVEDDVLKKIINKKIEGKNFSDRIWNNKNAVAKELKLEINRFLNGENNISDISKAIEKKFNANFNNSNRLVRDSIGRVQEGANAEWRKKHNIKYVLRDATLDMRTCSKCAELDQKVYKVGEEPPAILHPNCRCTYISLVNKEWRPKEKYDNNSKKRINYTTYEEWKKNNVEKSGKDDILSSKKWIKADFSSKKKFDKHIEKHLHEYGGISEKEYLEYARKLLSKPIGKDIEGFASKDGFIFKYQKSTNDIAIGRPDGYISTLFKPDEKYDYWLQQIEKYKE